MFNRKRNRPLHALQIEVTSRCTRSCRICPRTDLKDMWRNGDLSKDLWEAVVPDLRLAEHIHLQGWGEPLLHPMLVEWARQSREADCSVGITTNGELLSDAFPWLLEGNVNLITLSVAGANKRHSVMRDGLQFLQLMDSTNELVMRSRERGLHIKVQLSYLLTRSNAYELPEAVQMAADAGLDEVFVIHLDCRTSRLKVDQSAYNDKSILPNVEPYLKEAKRIARRRMIGFRGPSGTKAEVLACALNPMYFTFITWDGRVGPCTYLLLPISGPIPRYTDTEVHYIEPVSFGFLDDKSLSQLLLSKERKLFIDPFQKRLDAEKQFVEQIDMEASIRALRKIELASEKREKTLSQNPFPDACAGCQKALGW